MSYHINDHPWTKTKDQKPITHHQKRKVNKNHPDMKRLYVEKKVWEYLNNGGKITKLEIKKSANKQRELSAGLSADFYDADHFLSNHGLHTGMGLYWL